MLLNCSVGEDSSESLGLQIKPVNPKGNQSWIFIGRIDAEAETPILWPPKWRTDSLEKTLTLRKTEGRRRRGRQRMRWLDDITNFQSLLKLMSINRWCHPASSSSVAPFSSYPQSFPASGSFPVSQFFTSGGQSIGASASASFLIMNIQGWFPLELTGVIFLQFKGLSRSLTDCNRSLTDLFSSQNGSNAPVSTTEIKELLNFGKNLTHHASTQFCKLL